MSPVPNGAGLFSGNKDKRMKKIFTSIIFATIALTASAQISEGFYRIMNNYTKRYLTITSREGEVHISGGTVDLEALETIKPLEDISSHPGSCIYITPIKGTEYDMAVQGTTLSKIASGKIYPHFKPVDGGYLIYGEYNGTTVYLGDTPETATKDNGYMSMKPSKTKEWSVIKIDGGEQYLGIVPEVQADGYYWATFYCGFSFKLSSGMKAYYINGVSNNEFVLKEVSGDIVGATCPILIRCNGSKASDNKITPLTSGGDDPSDNQLRGIYFSNPDSKHNGYNKTYDSSSMRILGTSGGKLAFVKATSNDLVEGKYIEHNRCWLVVPSSASSTLTEGNAAGISTIKAEEVSKKGIYTLQGVEIPESTNLRPGIYIKDGKKVVIK